MLGHVSPEDLSFLSEQEALDYCQSFKFSKSSDGLAKITSGFSAELQELLKGLLEFNPYFRLSPKQCLKSSLFDEIRVPMLEIDAP